MRRISKVKVLLGYRLELEFDDGVSGIVDLSEAVGKGVSPCGATRSSSSRFVSVRPVNWSGANRLISHRPDALYLKVTGKKPEDIFPALRGQPTHA